METGTYREWWSCRDFFFFQAEDGIRDVAVTGVQTCALPIYRDVNGLSNCQCQFRCSPQTFQRFGSARDEVGREVRRGIGYVLVLSREDSRTSKHCDLCKVEQGWDAGP